MNIQVGKPRPGGTNQSMHRWVSYLLAMTVVSGCASHPSIGMFEDGREVFKGNAEPKLDVDVKMFVGESRFVLQGETSGTRCSGRTSVTVIPAMKSPGTNQCHGQKGEVVAKCSDDRSLRGEWSATSCKVGSGQGVDTNGTAFAFTFGLPEDTARRRLEKVLGISPGESMISNTGQRR